MYFKLFQFFLFLSFSFFVFFMPQRICRAAGSEQSLLQQLSRHVGSFSFFLSFFLSLSSSCRKEYAEQLGLNKVYYNNCHGMWVLSLSFFFFSLSSSFSSSSFFLYLSSSCLFLRLLLIPFFFSSPISFLNFVLFLSLFLLSRSVCFFCGFVWYFLWVSFF